MLKVKYKILIWLFVVYSLKANGFSCISDYHLTLHEIFTDGSQNAYSHIFTGEVLQVTELYRIKKSSVTVDFESPPISHLVKFKILKGHYGSFSTETVLVKLFSGLKKGEQWLIYSKVHNGDTLTIVYPCGSRARNLSDYYNDSKKKYVMVDQRDTIAILSEIHTIEKFWNIKLNRITRRDTFYNANKSIACIGNFKDGIADGFWRYYSINNLPVSTGSYAFGQKTGEWVRYNEKGFIKTKEMIFKGKYLSFALFSGTESQTLVHSEEKDMIYNNDTLSIVLAYHPNAMLKCRFFRKNVTTKYGVFGEKNGLFQEYHDNGKLKEEGYYQFQFGNSPSKKIGEWNTYDYEGRLIQRINYNKEY